MNVTHVDFSLFFLKREEKTKLRDFALFDRWIAPLSPHAPRASKMDSISILCITPSRYWVGGAVEEGADFAERCWTEANVFFSLYHSVVYSCRCCRDASTDDYRSATMMVKIGRRGRKRVEFFKTIWQLQSQFPGQRQDVFCLKQEV